MNKKYIVELTSEDRSKLQEMVKKGKGAAYRIKHAHILLKSDLTKLVYAVIELISTVEITKKVQC